MLGLLLAGQGLSGFMGEKVGCHSVSYLALPLLKSLSIPARANLLKLVIVAFRFLENAEFKRTLPVLSAKDANFSSIFLLRSASESPLMT